MKSKPLGVSAVLLAIAVAMSLSANRNATAQPSSNRTDNSGATTSRLEALFGKLSQGPNVAHERDDWQQLVSHCGQGQGELSAEVSIDRGTNQTAIRFVCNTAQRIQNQRVYGAGQFWATPWYSDKAFDREFYLAKYDRGVVLFDWAISGVTAKADFSSGVPYESSESVIEENRKGVVSSQMISTALRNWINGSSRRAQLRQQGQKAITDVLGTAPNFEKQ